MHKRTLMLGGSFFALSFAMGCGGADLPPVPVESGCHPLSAGSDCMLPFPSDFFRPADEDGVRRVRFSGLAKPRTKDNVSADPSEWLAFEGFSRSPTIVLRLAEPMRSDGLIGVHDDPGGSVAPSSPTLLLDAESGRRIAHFAEIDVRPEAEEDRALVITPIELLDASTRYVVAVSGVLGESGALARAPLGFARVRDDEASGDPHLEPMAERFEADVFAPLEAAGVERAELQMAWDFTTGPDDEVVGDMLRAKEIALEYLSGGDVAIEISGTRTDPDDPRVLRFVEGTVTVPLITERDAPMALLRRDAEGRVVASGTRNVPFMAVIPQKLAEEDRTGRFIAYGHGFFGGRDEIDYRPTIGLAEQLGAVMLSIDWVGMAEEDKTAIFVQIAEDPTRVMAFGDRVHQAMVDWIVVTGVVDQLAAQESFQLPSGRASFDPSEVHYLGISQGHILGGVHAALNPHIDNWVLQVGGSNFVMMMYRAEPFRAFLGAMELYFPDRLLQRGFTAVLQRYFDRFDPAAYANLAAAQNTNILLQIGLGDRQVPNAASYYHARALGAGYTGAQPPYAFELPMVETPHRGMAMTTFDFGEDLSFAEIANPPEEDNRVHEDVRKLESCVMQLEHFYVSSGEIIHPCAGACRSDSP